jgi:hypothetical protein
MAKLLTTPTNKRFKHEIFFVYKMAFLSYKIEPILFLFITKEQMTTTHLLEWTTSIAGEDMEQEELSPSLLVGMQNATAIWKTFW